MSTFAFWQELESKFGELEKAAGSLLEARYCSERDGYWILCGPAAKNALTMDAFTALGERGAAAAGKHGRPNDWLDLLRLEGSGLYPRLLLPVLETPLVPDDPAARRARRFSKRTVKRCPLESSEVGSVRNVIRASWVYCMARATSAFKLETVAATAGVPALSDDTNDRKARTEELARTADTPPDTKPNSASGPKTEETKGKTEVSAPDLLATTEQREAAMTAAERQLDLSAAVAASGNTSYQSVEVRLEGKGFVSLKTASDILGVKERQLRNLISSGKLTKTPAGKITTDSIRAYLGCASSKEIRQ